MAGPAPASLDSPRFASTGAAPSVQRVTFVVFSGDMDRLQAAFTMATGAAAFGIEVTMFFTFWGIAVLRTGKRTHRPALVARAFGWLIPAGARRARLSRLDMWGLGRWLMARQMRHAGVPSLEKLIALARESGVRFRVCESTMAVMGIDRSELTDDISPDLCGVAALWGDVGDGQVVFV